MVFSKFSELPTELRLEIWRSCLPHRVAELDMPYHGYYNTIDIENSGGCLLESTSRSNAVPPVITRVCHESRMVALEHGGLLTDDSQISWELRDVVPFGRSMAAGVWIDRRRDAVHLNWWGLYDFDFNDYMDPVPLWLAAAERSQGASLTVSLCEVDVHERGHTDLVGSRTLFVCLRVVSIHAPLQPAIDSGLFGHLGEERITLVAATDTERKEQYRAFWQKHGRRPDLNPYRFFYKWCQQDEWAREETAGLELQWLVARWLKVVKNSIPGAATVWQKKPSDGDTDYYQSIFSALDKEELMKTWTPNREHPWVKASSATLPQIRPTVMFRLCTYDCPGKRRTMGWPDGVDLFREPVN